MTLQELNKHIVQIDCGMLTTYTENEELNSRPMLTITDENEPNKLYFFCMKDSQKIVELERNSRISLSYQDKNNGINLHLFGTAKIIDQANEMQVHWDKKLNIWWQEEANTKGLCMIVVDIQKYRYWTIGESGTISLNPVQ